MSALYAFARRVDDIGDGAAAAAEKLEALGAVRDEIDGLGGGNAAGGRSGAASRSPTRWPRYRDRRPTRCARSSTGCEMDCRRPAVRDASTSSSSTAGASPDRSAGSRSRSSARPTTGRGAGLADTLGIALQLTNILRDVVEDRERDGSGLPARRGPRALRLCLGRDGPARRARRLVRFEAVAPAQRYDEGLGLLDLLDRRSRACVGGDGRHLPPPARPHRSAIRSPCSTTGSSLPGWEKAWVAARSLAGVGVVSTDASRTSSWSEAASPGSRRRSRCADAGGHGDASSRAGRASGARRGRSSATVSRSTTASTSTSAAAPPIDASSSGSAPSRRRRSAGRLAIPVLRPGTGAATRRRRGSGRGRAAGAASPRRFARSPTATSSSAIGCGSVGRCSRCAGSRLDDPRARRRDVRRVPPPPRSERRGDRAALGPHHAADDQPARRRGFARSRRKGLPDRAARARPTRPTSAGRDVPARRSARRSGACAPRGARRAPCIARAKVTAIELDRRRRGAAPATGVRRRRAGRGRRRRARRRPPRPPPSSLRPARHRHSAARLRRLGCSPIIDVHSSMTRKVMDYPVAAASTRPVQYVFDRTRPRDSSGGGQCSRCRSPAPTASTASDPRC